MQVSPEIYHPKVVLNAAVDFRATAGTGYKTTINLQAKRKRFLKRKRRLCSLIFKC
jgi:hypothetical protein